MMRACAVGLIVSLLAVASLGPALAETQASEADAETGAGWQTAAPKLSHDRTAASLPATTAPVEPKVDPKVLKANSWTLGLASGLPEGTFIRFAAEIARNL